MWTTWDNFMDVYPFSFVLVSLSIDSLNPLCIHFTKSKRKLTRFCISWYGSLMLCFAYSIAFLKLLCNSDLGDKPCNKQNYHNLDAFLNSIYHPWGLGTREIFRCKKMWETPWYQLIYETHLCKPVNGLERVWCPLKVLIEF